MQSYIFEDLVVAIGANTILTVFSQGDDKKGANLFKVQIVLPCTLHLTQADSL